MKEYYPALFPEMMHFALVQFVSYAGLMVVGIEAGTEDLVWPANVWDEMLNFV